MNKFLLAAAASSLLVSLGCGPTDTPTPTPDPTYTVGGNVTFTPDNGQVVTMQINGGETADSADGYYQFATALDDLSLYDVQVLTEPTDYSCSFDAENNSGTIAASNVIDIDVTCTEDLYVVSGAINGLVGTVTISSNGTSIDVSDPASTFEFPGISNNTAYDVVVESQPPFQACTVTDGAGTIDGADVSSVVIDCEKYIAFEGYVFWDQDVREQSDAEQDAMIDAACVAQYPGSRGATMDEIITAEVDNMPATNTSGAYLVPKCPNCEGRPDAFGFVSIEGHFRRCLENGFAYPTDTAGFNQGCVFGNPQNTAMCVK